MKSFVRTAFLAALLLTGGSVFGGQLSVGIRIGPPPAPRVVTVRPVSPGAGYMFVDGYWYPSGRTYKWHAGYWTRPPYAGAKWVAPRHDGQQYFVGYWDTDHGRIEHDHVSDKNRARDYRP